MTAIGTGVNGSPSGTVGNENEMFAIPVKQFASIFSLLPDETDPLETSTDEEPSKQNVFSTRADSCLEANLGFRKL